ncbi:2-C-methyl-D-erythritol 4-phosphate cytidylyltransferase [Permianibacter aggregans]|uniref:2-C-methyl-D-erythritol 4-phosphate cytidylyltransferase n=1 Tax=Permianibacter aggregans TaxID=1510150 RepID=A0A4R6UTW7_9GAMM|nr:2-C-methyl-D-erythritol 4-phosphate cytidylyltransferase [Permianibacter aggregans]QGX38815.1 2-C-methyl-D-erythritol 4-phosphate cytidylyltransferase [Permianibacter aggregans]TDQ50621.1 2-C-methyl-D-erythritol 4-phosphate cytidylyltransferase [Permianibacter aggregans]
MRCWAIIPAAGSGSRLGADRPKQYLSLHGATVLFHTLSFFLADSRFSQVLVALAADDQLFRHSDAAALPVQTVVGGDTRHASVLAALRALQGRAEDHDWVFVHDAARPLLLASDLQQLFTTLKDAETENFAGAILAVPVADTLKRVANDGTIEATVDRQGLWRAMTPQVFRFQALLTALISSESRAIAVTDEASAMEAAGHTVRIVRGRDDNIKITQGQDLMIAEQIFAWQRQQGWRD